MRVASPPPLDLDGICADVERLSRDGKSGELVALVRELFTRLQDRSKHLEPEIARLLRKHLGQTSERVSDPQLDLLRDLLKLDGSTPSDSGPVPEPVLAPPEVELPPAPKGKRRKKRGHGRGALPEHLPRVERIHRVPDGQRACAGCGAEKERIGYETSEELEHVPGSFHVVENKREKLACRPCGDGVTCAPPPATVIEKGRPGPGLLAQVVVSKYADHLPLNRQHTQYLRDGVNLPVSTMADWVAAMHRTAEPLVARITAHALAAHVLQGDDTGIKVLDRDALGGAKRGHLWCYVGDATWSVYRYTPDWNKEGPQSFLRGRRGWLVADADKGYDGLFTGPGATAVEVGCWAHARRPFAELALAGDPRAGPFVEHVRVLYAVEKRATECRVDPRERLAWRVKHSQPFVERIVAMSVDARGRFPPTDPLAKAAGYILNQRRALARFLEDGRLPIDNTLVERRLRPIAVARKNYLFCGSDAGAERAASAYTLLGCRALAGVDPRAYLTWVLRQLEMTRFPASRIDELLPANWAKVCPPSARVPSSR